MSLPQTEWRPDDPDNLSPARRRRARRGLVRLSLGERATAEENVARRASPSFDFFLYSLLAGCVLALGFWLDEPGLLLVGTLLAPVMAPVVGLALGTITGSTTYFFRSLLGFLVGAVLVWMTGFLAGISSRPWLPLVFSQAHQYTQLSWAHFLVLAMGSVSTTASMVRAKQGMRVASIILAYELYLPLAASGLGLGSGSEFLWPDGLVIFVMNLAWATLFGALTMAVLGFRPLTLFGYTFGGAVALGGLMLLVLLSGAGAVWTANVALPTPVPTGTPSPAPPTATLTLTHTPVPPTPTDTLTPTLTPSLAPTKTASPTATPVLALVSAPEEYGGARVRTDHSFSAPVIQTLANGTLVQILSTVPVEQEQARWVEVWVPEYNIQGWVVQALLLAATPAPNWEPSPTP
ncbi:MAG: DUF389 domain-containing protein [Chloroflexota bacterium]